MPRAARAHIYIHLISRHKTVVKCCKWNSNTHTHTDTHRRTLSQTHKHLANETARRPIKRNRVFWATLLLLFPSPCSSEKINVCRFAGRLCLFCHFWRLISQKNKAEKKKATSIYVRLSFIVCLSLHCLSVCLSSLSVPLSALAYYINTKSIYWLSALKKSACNLSHKEEKQVSFLWLV